jgi:hypothetical protein
MSGVIVVLLKDQATEVRVELMRHLKELIEVVGESEFDR